MNKVTITGLKVSAIGVVGSVASFAAAAKVSDVVYKTTEDINKAAAAGTLVGAGGLTATMATMATVADKDAENYTAEDMRKAGRINRALDSASSGLKTISNALKLAALLS